VTAASRHDDSGQGGIEALPLALLVFVVGALLIANAWAVIDAKLAASSAAREAARTYVEAPGSLTSDEAFRAARLAAEAAFAAQRGSSRPPQLRLISGDGGARERCTRVIAEATYRVPAVTVPWVGGFGRGFTVRARHSEIVDPFRSGLTGTATCVTGGNEP
jgi:Flp pilus assembly protein TadG